MSFFSRLRSAGALPVEGHLPGFEGATVKLPALVERVTSNRQAERPKTIEAFGGRVR